MIYLADGFEGCCGGCGWVYGQVWASIHKDGQMWAILDGPD